MNKIKMWWFYLVLRYAARLCADTPYMFVEIVTVGNQEYLRDDIGGMWALNRVPVVKMVKGVKDGA